MIPGNKNLKNDPKVFQNGPPESLKMTPRIMEHGSSSFPKWPGKKWPCAADRAISQRIKPEKQHYQKTKTAIVPFLCRRIERACVRTGPDRPTRRATKENTPAPRGKGVTLVASHLVSLDGHEDAVGLVRWEIGPDLSCTADVGLLLFVCCLFCLTNGTLTSHVH